MVCVMRSTNCPESGSIAPSSLTVSVVFLGLPSGFWARFPSQQKLATDTGLGKLKSEGEVEAS
jgi:hypothetical protein